MSKALPQIEDKYEVLRLLGEGGMGEVYLVRHRLLEALRVVKVMHSRLQEDSGLKARFLREAKAAVQLKHPHIAQVHDFWIDDDGDAFLVMEYIDGLNLNEMLKRFGVPDLELTLDIARQSLRALGYLHSKRFVHRDVAPDNLMLTRDVDGKPLIKLIDLGIAKELTAEADVTRAGFFVGKVHYASPEQFEPPVDGSDIDGRSDLYGFGIVLYLLLTGKYPIQGGSGSALIAGHLLMAPMSFEESDPQGRVPETMRSAVFKALEKRPEDRFATADEFMDALDGVVGSGRISRGAADDASMPTTIIDDLTRIHEDRIALESGATRAFAGEQKRAELTRVIEEVTELVKDDRLDDAETRIRQVFGDESADPAVRQLRQTILGRRESIDREQKAYELYEQAAKLREQGELEAARGAARASLGLVRNETTELLLKSLDRAIDQQDRIRNRAQRIDKLLQKGRLADVGALLRESEREFGEDRFEAQSQALETARIEDAENRVRAIATLIEEGQLERADAALEKFPSGLLASKVAMQRERLAGLRSKAADADRREREINTLLHEVELRLAEGKLPEAQELLEKGLSSYPEEQRFRSRLRQIESLEEEREETRAREERRRRIRDLLDSGLAEEAEAAINALDSTADAEDIAYFQGRLETAQRLATVVAHLREAREALDREQLDLAQQELEKARAIDRAQEGVVALEREIAAFERSKRIDLEQEELAEVAVSAALDAVRSATGGARRPAPRPPEEKVAPPSRPRWLLPAAAALIVVLLGSWFVSGRLRSPESPEVMSPRAQLVLDATPWAEMVEIRREDGTVIPAPEEDRFTPTLLELDPGRYEIRLENGASGEKRSVQLDLAPGANPRRVVELGPVDVDAYLSRVR